MIFVIFSTRFCCYAASDIDWKELSETTLVFTSRADAQALMDSCPLCWESGDTVVALVPGIMTGRELEVYQKLQASLDTAIPRL